MATALVFTSCKQDPIEETPVTESLTLLQSATNSDGVLISIYTELDQLYTGHNNVYFQLTNNGTVVSNANVSLSALMTMPSMSHATPVVQTEFDSNSNKYKSEIIFTMGSMAGVWTIDLDVNGTTTTFTLNVAESNSKVVGVYMGTDNENYIIALKRPINWQVGLNDINVMIYKKESMMLFTPVLDFETIMTPEMPAMGHGSPNNVSPVATSDGNYSGTVNYTMTGEWRLHFELLDNQGTQIHDDAYLDIEF